MRNLGFSCIALVAGLCVSAPVSAATLYGGNYTGSSDYLFEIDTATGAASDIGLTGVPYLGDLTSDTRAGSAEIYGIRLSGGNDLHTLDINTGVASFLTTITGAVGNIISIAFDVVSGVMYGTTTPGVTGGDVLHSINLATGVATSIGATGFNDLYALAFDTSGTLFGVSDDDGALVRIDTGTGAGTSVGLTGLSSVYDLAFDPDSERMFASDAGPDQLFTLNLITAASTIVGDYSNANAGNIAGLAFGVSEVPLPGAVPLLLTGLGAFGFAARRRRRAA